MLLDKLRDAVRRNVPRPNQKAEKKKRSPHKGKKQESRENSSLHGNPPFKISEVLEGRDVRCCTANDVR